MTTKPLTMRRSIDKLRDLAELLEKHPELPRPFAIVHTDGEVAAHFKFQRSYGLHGDDTRIDLEERMGALIDILDVPLEANDPSKDSWDAYVYKLTGKWHSMKVEIETYRADVCEKVVVGSFPKEVEVPDPELTKDIPMVKVVRTETITEWQCNEKLAETRAKVGAR